MTLPFRRRVGGSAVFILVVIFPIFVAKIIVIAEVIDKGVVVFGDLVVVFLIFLVVFLILIVFIVIIDVIFIVWPIITVVSGLLEFIHQLIEVDVILFAQAPKAHSRFIIIDIDVVPSKDLFESRVGAQ